MSPLSIGEAHASLSAQLASALRDAIVAGRYQAGERLVEDRLAQEMGVSRIPVREALRTLAAEGWVRIAPRRGASVAAMSQSLAKDMIEVRATLEGLNARLAARHRDEATLAALKQVLSEGSRAISAGRVAELIPLNGRFHDLLGQAGSNLVLQDMMRMLRERTAPFFAAMSRRRARETWDEHAHIVRAVILGDEEAAAMLAARHVSSAGERVLAGLYGGSGGRAPGRTGDARAARPAPSGVATPGSPG